MTSRPFAPPPMPPPGPLLGRAGGRVRVRGLIWDVLDVLHVNDRGHFRLRCAEGDMTGLELEIFSPPEPMEPVEVVFDPRRPAPLALWRLAHRAYRLNELTDGPTPGAGNPGRVRIEPYQLVPLMRALDMPRPRLLLADGVGLGKTVQACLIAAELIARRRAHRILIVSPAGPLLGQWAQETRLRFGLIFTRITSAAEMWDVRRGHELGSNPFDAVTLCLTTLDFAKQDHVLEEVERSAWDLVIIDEAHHCIASGPAGASVNTHRRTLAEVLARRSDALLLLTATPHDGHDAHFVSLIALLDPSLVDGAGGFVGDLYRRHVIRRQKSHIRDPRTGAPLFRQRRVIPVRVDVSGPEHEPVRAFHRALSAFVVPRLRRRDGADDALAFVSLLKRSVSTIAASLGTLRVVADRMARHAAGQVESAAQKAERGRALRAWRRRAARFGGLSAAAEAGQDALEIESMAAVLHQETDTEIGRLIQLGIAAEPFDPKLAAIILEIRLIRIEHPKANILIYTEYADSQRAIASALLGTPMIDGEILIIGGQDSDEIREAAAHRFGEDTNLILISTDALSEGLNLHRHCFHLIHLDLPYNPNRLEQRNGRIDRYGQAHEPEIRYLYLPSTFEERLLLHLITKYERARAALDVMPDTLGVTGDMDDTASLTGGLSEDPDDLFGDDPDAIRSLDRAAADSSPETVAALLREIDRAFESFDLMAVSHGWFAARADAPWDANASEDATRTAPSEDLASFVASVIAARTGQPPADSPFVLPLDWTMGLDTMPGFDAQTKTFKITRDPEVWMDHTGHVTGYLGRAHPLVVRAIREGCRLPGEVALAVGDRLSLLLTFELEIPAANRVMRRQVIGITVEPRGPPTETADWHALPFVAADHPGEELIKIFLPWVDQARIAAAELMASITDRESAAFAARHASSQAMEAARWQRWLRVKAEQLCGRFIAPTGDLFGTVDPGPEWHRQEDPMTRLVSFATDPGLPAARRREANGVIEAWQTAMAMVSTPDPPRFRPIGMLMVVPDARSPDARS